MPDGFSAVPTAPPIAYNPHQAVTPPAVLAVGRSTVGLIVGACLGLCLVGATTVAYLAHNNQDGLDESAVNEAMTCMQASYLRTTGQFVTLDNIRSIGYYQTKSNLQNLQKSGDRGIAREMLLAIHCQPRR